MSDRTLDALLSPIRKSVDAALEEALSDIEPKRLRDACLHYPRAGGKRWRPAVASLACTATGGAPHTCLPLGVALELIHNFSLIHDDFMDNDLVRRGIPAVHVKFGVPTAIVAGDTLFAKAFEVLAGRGAPPEVVHDVAQCSREICEGQEMDMAFSSASVEEKDYEVMIYKKTARIFEAAAANGARLGDADARTVRDLGLYGRHFGSAFQIVDDLLNLESPELGKGKPLYSDLREGKKTAILLHAIRAATPADRKRVLSKVGRGRISARDARAVLDLFGKTGSLDHARGLAADHLAKARRALSRLPASEAKDGLLLLLSYAESRRA
ncbi:MAG: polyprenyl synthetase family protein [Methanobacteriota archaeon]